jgi:hypothetical protein
MWNRHMTPEEAAAVIERFLDGAPNSIEWRAQLDRVV